MNSRTVTVGRISLPGYKCERCKHEWFPRRRRYDKGGDPVICPKCKSAYWDIPVVKKEKKK